MVTSRWRARSAARSGLGGARTRRRARLASWLRGVDGPAKHGRDLAERHREQVVQHERQPLRRRSVSSTTSRARPTESASTASSSGWRSGRPDATRRDPAASSPPPARIADRLFMPVPARAEHVQRTRAITVVSQPPRLSTWLASAPVSRSQVSWTASSASGSSPAGGTRPPAGDRGAPQTQLPAVSVGHRSHSPLVGSALL